MDLELALARAGVTLVSYADEQVLTFGLPDPDSREPMEWWAVQLKTWHANGTFDRLKAAMDARQPVRVRRSDGSISVGYLKTIAGFAGREVEVEVDSLMGPRYKRSPTEDFLELNPGFGPHLKELTE